MQLLCNCSSYFYKKAVIGRVSGMLLCGRYLLGTTTIAIHLEATVPHRELRAARKKLAWTWGSYVLQLFAVEENGGAWAGELCRLHLSPWLSESAWKAAPPCMHHSPSPGPGAKTLHQQGPNTASSPAIWSTAAWLAAW